MLQIRIRIVDGKGDLYPRHSGNARRKHLCQNWWNDAFLGRTLAVCQFLADDEMIVLGGEPDEQILVHSQPVSLKAPIGIDESSLDTQGYQTYGFELDDDEEAEQELDLDGDDNE